MSNYPDLVLLLSGVVALHQEALQATFFDLAQPRCEPDLSKPLDEANKQFCFNLLFFFIFLILDTDTAIMYWLYYYYFVLSFLRVLIVIGYL